MGRSYSKILIYQNFHPNYWSLIFAFFLKGNRGTTDRPNKNQSCPGEHILRNVKKSDVSLKKTFCTSAALLLIHHNLHNVCFRSVSKLFLRVNTAPGAASGVASASAACSTAAASSSDGGESPSVMCASGLRGSWGSGRGVLGERREEREKRFYVQHQCIFVFHILYKMSTCLNLSIFIAILHLIFFRRYQTTVGIQSSALISRFFWWPSIDSIQFSLWMFWLLCIVVSDWPILPIQSLHKTYMVHNTIIAIIAGSPNCSGTLRPPPQRRPPPCLPRHLRHRR